MNRTEIPRIMFAAPSSGSGKTTLTCAFLQALKNRNVNAVSFKCGPDYIDPMFHQKVLDTPSRNLDLFMLNEDTVIGLFQRNAQSCDIAVTEGVMGFYDGAGTAGLEASSYELSRLTQTPAVLIADCRGAAASSAALIKGFMEFRKDNTIRGVILNNVSERYYPVLRDFIETELGIKVYGYMPRLKDCELKSRHLGLITAEEVEDLRYVLAKLSEQAEKSLDIDGLIRLAEDAPPLPYKESLRTYEKREVTVGAALDKAFCFYYQDGLDLLEEMGAKIVFFSPLTDARLPEGLDGIILGGGYPELYAEQLSENKSFREHLKSLAESGIPCFAECGGFMYLHDSLEDADGDSYEMCGIVRAHSFRTGSLQRFGYVELTAEQDNILCRSGDKIKAHEFHYWDSTLEQDVFTARKSDGRQWGAFYSYKNLLAGYPHIHFCSNPGFAESFIKACGSYRQDREAERWK